MKWVEGDLSMGQVFAYSGHIAFRHVDTDRVDLFGLAAVGLKIFDEGADNGLIAPFTGKQQALLVQVVKGLI